MTGRPRLALAVLVLPLVACTGQGSARHTAMPHPTVASAAPSPVALACSDAIDTNADTDGLQVVLGAVALPVSPAHPALQTARTGETGPTRLFAKTGLAVRRGASVELVLPAAVAQHARIGWGNPGVPSDRVAVAGCSPAGSGRWLAFAGGYWTDEPACTPLVVRVGDKQEQVRIGLGVGCPGQRPPPQPTER